MSACDIKIEDDFKETMEQGKVYRYKGYLLWKTSNNIRQLQDMKRSLKKSDDFTSKVGRTNYRGALWKGFYSDMMNINKEGGGVPYPNAKKPIRLMENMLKYLDVDGQIVLDFFSGSSSTAEAVLNFNRHNNRKNKFIMIQIDEKVEDKKDGKLAYKFCVDNQITFSIPSIAKERIKRAAKKIKEDNIDKPYINNLDFGFKVYKTKELENSNYLEELDNFDPSKEMLFSNSVMNYDELYSLATTWKTHDGVPLTTPFKHISFNSYEALLVNDRLYLMFDNFTTQALQELLRHNDEDPELLINFVIVYGINFSSKHIKEIAEGVKMHNKKSANIELEVRY